MKKFKIDRIVRLIDRRIWIVFFFFAVIIFFVFRDLFNSYFEADEWFHFTYYLPLTKKPDGFLTAIVSTIISSGPLSAGQHIVPIASAIYFLNTKFFGMNYAPYAFMSLLLQSINSFLIFVLMRIFLNRMETVKKNIFAILGGLFFALSPQHSHTITGAAPFYGQNILSVTFFLLCILSFKLAYLRGNKKFIYLSVLFLFLSLFTKETAVFLFLLLPFMGWTELRLRRERGNPAASRTRQRWSRNNQVFPPKFLGKLFILSLIIYAAFRFLVPNVYQGVGPLVDRLVQNYVSSTLPSWQKQSRQESQEITASDTGTIVSTDLSIHKNLPGEILFRSLTFPVKMTGTLFLPRQTVFSIVSFITPIVQPVPPGGDSAEESQARLGFVYGTGNALIIYLASIIILIFCLRQIFKFIEKKQIQDAQALSIGLVIIILGALPLVAIIFSFPRWGYDFYFDSRFYYNPNVGAAIIFPFLLLGFSEFISKSFRKKTVVPLIAFILFTLWLINNIVVLNGDIRYFTQNFQPDRREVVTQLKKHLPSLPKITVFHIETDGLSAYGPILPFQTSVPQALTVVYYDRSPLPDSFFDKPLFNDKGQGYEYSDGRGFGYYTSKENLAEDLVAGDFEVSNIRAFYYEAKKIKVNDITSKIRSEMEEYLKDAEENSTWEKYSDFPGLSFMYPPQTILTQNESSIRFDNSIFTLDIAFVDVSQGFDLNGYVKVSQVRDSFEVMPKKVSFDSFHYNDSVVIIGDNQNQYLIRLGDKLIQAKTFTMNTDSLQVIERILGSIELIEQK